MQIINVTVQENRRTVPVRGWEGVTKVLTAFSSGLPRGTCDTTQETLKDIGESHGARGGDAQAMFMMGALSVGKPDGLVTRLLQEAKETLQKRNQHHADYDYDGMGTPFFKTNVTIGKLSGAKDMFAIGLWAAYVGDKPEIGLAEYLKVPRALYSSSVEVETNRAPNNRFVFDFNQVVGKLDSVLSFMKSETLGKVPTGADIARAMLKEEDGESRAIFLLQDKDGLQVRIFPNRVERRRSFDRKSVKMVDSWSVEGSKLSGNLRRDYTTDDESVKATPTFTISVSEPALDDRGGNRAVWEPERQREMIALSKKIAEAMKA